MSSVDSSQDTRAPLWRNVRFTRFWAGHAVSAFGDQISALSVPLVAVVSLQATPAQVGYVTAAVWLPNLASLIVGAWVDQHARPQRLLVAADLIRACAMLIVPVAFAADLLSLPVLCAGCLALGAGAVLYNTSYQAFFVQLVPSGQFVAANSLLSTTLAVAGLAGPALAGLLVQTVGAPKALLADAASFACCGACVARVPLLPSRRPAATDVFVPMRTRLRDGLRYLGRHWYLRTSLAASSTMNLGAFIIQAVLVLHASRHLGMSPGAIGLALGIGAAGGLLGASSTPAVTRRIGTGAAIATGAALSTAPIAALLLADGARDGFWLLALGEFVCAWATMLFDINNNSARACLTSDDMRARVAGAYSTINYGSRPLGALLGGWLASSIGIPATIAAGAVIALLAPAWIICSPTITITDLDEAIQPPA